jgi:hypothetical protein
MTVLLEAPVRHWACPSCSVTSRTQEAQPHTRMHSCAGLSGLTAPMVEVEHDGDHPDARHLVLERQDYAGSPFVPRFMGVRTEHGDGRVDATAFAETALMKVRK